MNWKKKFDRVPGLVITVLLLVVSVIFMVMLARTKMIPDTYMIVAGVILFLFVVLTAALVWRMSNKIRFTVGALLGFVFIAILAIGGAYVNQTRKAITRISGEKTEITKISVYVKAEDTADSVDATKGDTYGILQALDRTNTDGAVAHLKSQFDTDVNTGEFPGLTELADGLLNGQV
ncbi:MAG: hypothetical protein ACLSDT_09845, partial [Blautia sp.]